MAPKSKKTNTVNRGRKPRDHVDFCQTAFWAWTVRHELNLDFSKIERLLNPSCFTRREDDGGYMQPQLWRKYGKGIVSPTGNGTSNKCRGTAIELAEKLAPGTSVAYESILWTVLRAKERKQTIGEEYANQLTPSVRNEISRLSSEGSGSWTGLVSLSVDSLSELARLPQIDVLAALLMVFGVEIGLTRQFQIVGLIRWWLMHSILRDGAIRSVRYLLLPVLEGYESKLGRLSGTDDLSLSRTVEENGRELFRAVFFDPIWSDDDQSRPLIWRFA